MFRTSKTALRTLTASAVALTVALPVSAQAFGGPGGGGQRACAGGPAAMAQTLDKVTVSLSDAVTKALGVASGDIAMARLAPATPGMMGGQGSRGAMGAMSAPDSVPVYMIALFDDDSRTMVAVDAATGEAKVVGAASGLMAQRMGRHGGRFGTPLTDPAVSAGDAITKALEAAGGGTAVMARSGQKDFSKAWIVAVVPPATDDGAPASTTLVKVDAMTGTVVGTMDNVGFGACDRSGPGGRMGGSGHGGWRN